MAQINTGKVIVGGIAGAVVLNVIDYCVNGVWLASRWKAQSAALNPKLDAMSGTAITGYVVLDIVLAFLIVWLYAAIRPRFGPGPRTASIAAIAVWLTAAVFNGLMVTGGMFGPKLVAASVGGTLVGMLLAGNLGAMLYKEE